MGSDEPKPPSIDERIQALTQSLELLAAMHRDLENMHRDLEKQVAERFTETLGFINRLARVVDAREHRIQRLEDKE
jgi:type II secretory pathway component PulJ